MKRSLLLVAFGLLFGAQSYAFEGRVSFGVFYDALQPYGEWISVADYGYCWHPYGVDSGWRPYANGRWAWTDDGWFWVSYEPWGWAPYHYGRWAFEPACGWIWIPDYEWGPSWVQWRISNGYIGWAPLPPRAGWHISVGFDAGDFGIPYFGWCFTAGNGFYSDHPVLFGVGRNRHFLHATRNVTNIYINNGRVINRGPDYATVGRMARTRITPIRIVDERNPEMGQGRRFEGDRIRVYRPEIRPESRGEFENRVRVGVPRDQQMREGRRSEPGNRGTIEGARQPGREDSRSGRMNVRPDQGNPNVSPARPQEEIKNFHSQPNDQPRFNIPQRKEEPRREIAPSRQQEQHRQPQVERRREESHPQMDRRGGGDHRESGRRR